MQPSQHSQTKQASKQASKEASLESTSFKPPPINGNHQPQACQPLATL
jgi:hypothetical protein